MVRYLIPSLVVGLLVGGGMNITLADENEVTISRTEYETLLQQVQDTKSDTEKILEILEGKQENVEGGEEAVPSNNSRSGGGEVNDTNDNDSGEERVSSSGVEAEEVDKEVDKEEEVETEDKEEETDKEVDKEEEVLCPSCDLVTDKSEIDKNADGLCNICTDRMIKCPKCGEYHHKLYVEKGECYNLYECSNCFKEFTKEKLDENWNCEECASNIGKGVVPPTEEEPTIQDPPGTEGEPEEPQPEVPEPELPTPEVPQPTPEPESSQQELPEPQPEIEYSTDPESSRPEVPEKPELPEPRPNHTIIYDSDNEGGIENE